MKPGAHEGVGWRGRSGLSLVEVMVTTMVLSIGVLAAIGTFSYLGSSVIQSRAKSLASNLSQEQIEKLKNLSYYMLLVTTHTYSNPNITPPIAYDTGHYPAQTIIEGGISFIRGTRVDFAYHQGATVSTVPWTSNDTGVKKITVYTVWRDERGWHHSELSNLVANPSADPLNSIFTGTVRRSGTPVRNVLVKVLENPSWYGYTDASGVYNFTVSAGSYTLQASSGGYYTQTSPLLSITEGATLTRDFSITLVASGTVTGTAYTTDHIVVSQIVASTESAPAVYTEFIELYNPTTSYVQIADAFGTPQIEVRYQVPAGVQTPITLTYAALPSGIPAHGYYLIAKDPSVTIAGVTRTADARYTAGANILRDAFVIPSISGSVGVGYSATATWIDVVGWKKGANPSAFEGNFENEASGLEDNEQLIRRASPTSWSAGQGRAYDSNDNEIDFDTPKPIIYPVRNSSDVESPVAGTPASGALVNINDGLSTTTACVDTTVAGVPVCAFSVVGVATGTWSLFALLGTSYAEYSNVVVSASVSTGVPNGSTLPVWPAVNETAVLLDQTTNYGFISGTVYTAGASPLSGVQIAGGEELTYTNASGRYLLRAPAGLVQVIANADYGLANYIVESTELTVSAGSLYDPIDFYLSQGGVMRGYFQTSASTPLPGRVAVAKRSGNQVGQATSESNGYFYIRNLTTGTYTIEPALDAAESASPTTISQTLSTPGSTVILSTITVTNSLGQITGQVLDSGDPIDTGVLILASSSTLGGTSSSPPPALSGTTGPLCAPCYYSASSQASGEYTIEVRSGATPYQLYAWYTTFSGDTPTTTRVGPFPVTVATGGSIMTQDFSW